MEEREEKNWPTGQIYPQHNAEQFETDNILKEPRSEGYKEETPDNGCLKRKLYWYGESWEMGKLQIKTFHKDRKITKKTRNLKLHFVFFRDNTFQIYIIQFTHNTPKWGEKKMNDLHCR